MTTQATSEASAPFRELAAEVGPIARRVHTSAVLLNARRNTAFTTKSIRDLPRLQGEKAESAVIISAGPSLRKRGTLKRLARSGYRGALIAVDGSYVACLREGLVPDFVLSLDPHPTRIVRWFGDPEWAESSSRDDYFERQDLDTEFRSDSALTNRANIDLVDRHAVDSKLILASSASRRVVSRVLQAGFEIYWWHPLIDDPTQPGSLTRKLHELNALPCLNTGGTVGSAAWVFAASRLKIPKLAVVGMDFGYPANTPLKQTQTYYELVAHLGRADDLDDYFPSFDCPLTGETFFTDPTYYWYRKNFLELIARAPDIQTVNCTEGGTLPSDALECTPLEAFLNG